jgi:synaptotagmin-7
MQSSAVPPKLQHLCEFHNRRKKLKTFAKKNLKFENFSFFLSFFKGKELPAKDLSGTSDPYVRVTLLPDKKHRLETKIKRRTLNPRWNETFYFEGFPVQKLQSRILHLHVFDYDRFSRDDSIGEVFLPLCQVDFSGKPSFWKALKPPAKDKCGELLCSLCYHPSNSILTLSLVKARNLKAKDINGKSGEKLARGE